MQIADMHTHSEYSHDSSCPIEEMRKAQVEKGTNIFAVSDHFDTYAYKDYDIFTPIQKSFETVAKINEREEGKTLLLAGIEISEAFWHPNLYEKIKKLCDYDVVLGSVHFVRFDKIPVPYSIFDFSSTNKETRDAFLCAYFDDMEKLIDFTDMDILTHLTCPIRYITGKFGFAISMEKYQEKIDRILEKIISRNIALEINTSTFSKMGSFMPDEKIAKRYFDLGGRLLTLGSDAHQSENASGYFNDALQMLKTIGFPNIYYYKKRKAFPLPL